jgi:hypothetical protein
MIETQPRLTASSGSLDTPPASLEAPTAGTMTTLISGILDDAQKLARQQFDMLKAEVHEDLRQSRRAAEYGGLGVVMLTVGFLGLVTAVAYFLHEYFQFSMWASWAITSGVFIALGIGLAMTSYMLLERLSPLPSKTIHALQENLKWKTT